jgi:PAS domain S-box-containing protein
MSGKAKYPLGGGFTQRRPTLPAPVAIQARAVSSSTSGRRQREGPVQNELTLQRVVDGIAALAAVLTPDGAVEDVNRQLLDYFGKTLEELREWANTDTAGEALRETEHHLELVVETIPALVARTTAEGSLDYVNRRVSDYLGLEMGQLGIHVVHPDDRYARMGKWRQALKTGASWEDMCRLRRADGEFRWFYQRAEPLLDRDGRVVCWYSVSIDINDCREMEDMLRSTRQKLSAAMQVATVAELSASIAHEINQPLASIVTNAHASQQWLSHAPPNLERAQATLERIIRDGHAAADVVRRIRALFKETAPVKTLLAMSQIVDEVLRVLSVELRDNSIIVEAEMEHNLPMIDADHVQIQQTLINLVHNAIEAMDTVTDRTKSLVLGARRAGEELLIQVRDNGTGITDSTVIFEPFFTTKGSGMGMGLSICRTIVEAHGGRIWATANVDAGTTLSLTLPLAADRSA